MSLMADTEIFSREELREIREAFVLFDKDGDGTIDAEDLGTLLRALGKTPTQSDLKGMIRETDVSGTGRITLDGFMYLMSRKGIDGEAFQAMVDAFRLFDTDGDGFILVHELRHVMTNSGEKLTQEEAKELTRLADRRGDGLVDYVEFAKMMSCTLH